MMFYDFFILIQLEYLINHNRSNPTLKMVNQGLMPKCWYWKKTRGFVPFGLYSHLISLRVDNAPGTPTTFQPP